MLTGLRKSPGRTVNPYKLSALHLRQQVPNTPRPPLKIDGLAAVVTQQYGGQLNEESLFLFCGRRTDRIKTLHWTGDGYVLLYKRLSNGRFQWPRSEAELKLLGSQSFRWLMEGLHIEQKTAIRKGKPKDLFWQKYS